MIQDGPLPSLNARSLPQAKLNAKPSAKAAQYEKEAQRRAKLQNISQICILIIGSISYGFAMTVVCFAMGYLFTSPLSKMLGDLIFRVLIGSSQALVPQFLASYATWLFLGIPALVLGAQVAYALATKTHGLSLQARSWLKTLINVVGYSLPFVAFPCGMMFGAPLVPLLWVTWGLGTISGFYMMFLQHLVNQLFLEQNHRSSARQALQGNQVPPLRESIQQRLDNSYLPSYQNMQEFERTLDEDCKKLRSNSRLLDTQRFAEELNAKRSLSLPQTDRLSQMKQMNEEELMRFIRRGMKS